LTQITILQYERSSVDNRCNVYIYRSSTVHAYRRRGLLYLYIKTLSMLLLSTTTWNPLVPLHVSACVDQALM